MFEIKIGLYIANTAECKDFADGSRLCEYDVLLPEIFLFPIGWEAHGSGIYLRI